jgi:hypothetical protein
MKKLSKRKPIKKSTARRNPRFSAFDGNPVNDVLITLEAATERNTKYSVYYQSIQELIEADLKIGELIDLTSSRTKTLKYLENYKYVLDHLIKDIDF